MIRVAEVRAARKRYQKIAPVLNEQSRRRLVAFEARALGHGGVSLMARATDWRDEQFIADFPTLAMTCRLRVTASARAAVGGRRKHPRIELFC
jgi:hypothetical protein